MAYSAIWRGSWPAGRCGFTMGRAGLITGRAGATEDGGNGSPRSAIAPSALSCLATSSETRRLSPTPKGACGLMKVTWRMRISFALSAFGLLGRGFEGDQQVLDRAGIVEAADVT